MVLLLCLLGNHWLNVRGGNQCYSCEMDKELAQRQTTVAYVKR